MIGRARVVMKGKYKVLFSTEEEKSPLVVLF